MSLFPCRECGCVENTACCNYWSRACEKQPLLCSACDPHINEWHGRFERRSATGYLVDQEGHLWRDADQLPSHSRILGHVESMRPVVIDPAAAYTERTGRYLSLTERMAERGVHDQQSDGSI